MARAADASRTLVRGGRLMKKPCAADCAMRDPFEGLPAGPTPANPLSAALSPSQRGPAPGLRRARSPSAPAAGRGRRELAGEGVLTREHLERGRNLPPPRNTELLAQDVAVCLRRPRGDAELEPDLLVGAAAGDQLDDLELALGESDRRLAWCAGHGRGGYAPSHRPT